MSKGSKDTRTPDHKKRREAHIWTNLSQKTTCSNCHQFNQCVRCRDKDRRKKETE